MNLENGNVDCILDEEISNASVYKNRIFYLKTEISEPEGGSYLIKTSYFKCNLDGSNKERVLDFLFSFENDICVSEADGIIQKVDLSNNEVAEIAKESNMVSQLSIYNGYVYYIKSSASELDTALVKINLDDKSVNSYSAKEAYFEDYGFLDDKLCLYSAEGAFYLLQDEALVKYENSETYDSIYSCGGKLYGLKPGGKLCELHLNDENGFKSVSEAEIEGNKNEA